MFEREDWRVKNFESRVWKTGLCLYQRRHAVHFDRCCYRCHVASFVSDSVRPHKRQPTRLPHPWDSPGKNTGGGSPVHESEKWKCSRSVVSDSSRPHGLQPTRLLRTWDLPSKSAGVGCHCLLRFWPQSFLIVDFVCDHWPVARSAPGNSLITPVLLPSLPYSTCPKECFDWNYLSFWHFAANPTELN